MKVAGVRTVRLPEHPQMLWLQVLTDEGITGLGETCLGPATVEAHLHETVAPYLIGQDPGRLAGRTRDSIRIYNTCAGPGYGRGNKGALKASDRATAGDRGLAAGPYEDLRAAIDRPGERAGDLLAQGISGMKVWPFDQYAVATGGHDIRPDDLRAGVRVIEQIRDAAGGALDLPLEMHALSHLPAAVRT